MIELMVVMLILGILLSLLLPAASKTLATSRGFSCKMGLRSVAFDFGVFCEPSSNAERGEDQDAPNDSFRLETFQEYVYGIDEFWRYEDDDVHMVPDQQGNDPLRCPEVDGLIALQRNTPCSQGAISPTRYISFGFNLRLHIGERNVNGRTRYVPVYVNDAVRSEPLVPLVWDVDGAAAEAASQYPVWSAPTLTSTGPFAGNRYWYPGLRHNGEMNVAFVDGHAESTSRPLEMPNWMWGYQVPGR